MLDGRPFARSISAADAERQAGAYLPEFESRMPTHIAPEVEGLLQAVRDHKVARALRERTQQASPETTRLIQMGLFAPDFSITSISVYDEEGNRVENPKPYQVWEATKEMRTVMTSVIAGLMTDDMTAVGEGKTAHIWIPEERRIRDFGRRINAVNIVPSRFRGFGRFTTNSGEPFIPQRAIWTVSPESEYMQQVEHIITGEWFGGQRSALSDVLKAIRGLDSQHPLRIMDSNLKQIVEYGLDPAHKLIERNPKEGDLV